MNPPMIPLPTKDSISNPSPQQNLEGGEQLSEGAVQDLELKISQASESTLPVTSSDQKIIVNDDINEVDGKPIGSPVTMGVREDIKNEVGSFPDMLVNTYSQFEN